MSAATGVSLIEGKKDVGATSPEDVLVGSIVKAIYLELWVVGDGQQPATIITEVEKVVGSAVSGADATDLANLQNYKNKSNIFEIHQGIIGDANTNPVPFFRHWIKIPKGFQRFALNDRLELRILSQTEGMQFCGVAIFKVYT